MIKKVITIALALIYTASVNFIPTAYAIDEDFYSANEIFFYDPNACRIATGIGTGNNSGSGGSTGAAENIEAVLRYFTDKGLSLAAAAGFVGNMTQESNVNPRIIQGGAMADDNYTPVNGKGFGLVQWTFTARQAPLVALAQSTNRSVTDINLQLDYIWQELNAGYQETLSKLNTPGITPQEATIIIHGNTKHTNGHPAFAIAPKLGYEASADTANAVLTKRVPPAVAAYDKYKGTIADGDPSKIQITSDTSAAASAGNPMGAGDCGTNAGTSYSVNGMTFPVIANKQLIEGGPNRDGKNTWCYTKANNCHHDYNAADIMVPEGTQIVAIKAGEIVSVNNNANGAAGGKRATITLRADDDSGLWFMTHATPGSATVEKGQKVASGAPLMTVGNSAAADNTPPHLHIDQLPSQFQTRVSCAGAGCSSYPFIDIQSMLKQIYDSMTASQTQAQTTPGAKYE